MKLNKYLKDKSPEIVVFIIFYILITLILLAFKSQKELNIFIRFLLLIMGLIILSIDYLRKRKFYNNLLTNIKNLDQKYLLIEFINKPEFYEGKIFYELLYEINSFDVSYDSGSIWIGAEYPSNRLTWPTLELFIL